MVRDGKKDLKEYEHAWIINKKKKVNQNNVFCCIEIYIHTEKNSYIDSYQKKICPLRSETDGWIFPIMVQLTICQKKSVSKPSRYLVIESSVGKNLRFKRIAIEKKILSFPKKCFGGSWSRFFPQSSSLGLENSIP